MAKISQDYNLHIINPALAREWHPTKNGALTPKDVTPNSHKRIWWLCSRDHEWEARIASRNRGTGCPYCSGKAVSEDNCLQTVNPTLAKEWHPTKNGSLTPRDVTRYSNKKVWWLCSSNRDHEWEATINDRNNGTGCPYCSGRKATENTSLQTVNPSLAKEWHPTKNGALTPKDVMPNSHKKVWWLCTKRHEWEATIANRNNGRGCPFCSGKAVCEDNCLQTVNPRLAKEWHPTRNGGLTPKDVTTGSGVKVWWLCSSNRGHEWEATISDRTRGRGCPYCSGRKNPRKAERRQRRPP